MKKLFIFLVGLTMVFSLTSCVTTAYAYDDMYDDADIEVVVTYGTPYYNAEGLLLYYIYRDLYYYPYFYNDRYYLHRYYRPLPPNRMRHYRPVPRDFYRHNPPHRHHHNVNPRGMGGHNNHYMTPNGHPRHNNSITPRNHSQYRMGGNRPNNGGMRTMTPRSSTRPSGGFGGGHRYGGRR